MAYMRSQAARPGPDGGSLESGRPTLSLIVPMYDEQDNCLPFLARVLPILLSITDAFEIVCVDDGSRDNTTALLEVVHAQDPRVKIVRLTRNFGKEPALTAGLDFSTGDAVIPIDADLQDPPELIPRLVAEWRAGYDMVLAVRTDRRGDSLAKRLTARLFYRLARRLSEAPLPADAGDFRLMDRRVVEALRRLPERTRFNKGLYAWLGFSQTTVPFARPPRAAGVSKWRYWKLWNLALDGIFSFTTLPLRVWTYVGTLTALGALGYALFILGWVLMGGATVPGYASTVILVLFFSGLNLIGLGIVGEYLGRVFVEVKQRPLYLVRDTVGFEPAAAGSPRSRSKAAAA